MSNAGEDRPPREEEGHYSLSVKGLQNKEKAGEQGTTEAGPSLDIQSLADEAVNEDRPSHIIGQSEEPVRDAVGQFRQTLFAEALALRSQHDALEAHSTLIRLYANTGPRTAYGPRISSPEACTDRDKRGVSSLTWLQSPVR
jgi:hypothetical protein